MADSLLATFGIYGGAFAISFLGGLFPIVSVEVFIVGLLALGHVTLGEAAALALLGAAGHQVAKTITYFAATGALERGKLAAKVERLRTRIERWNKQPVLVLLASATVGIPPIYVIGFIAHPLMRIRFWTFTAVCLAGRFARLIVIGAAPLLWK